MKTKILFTVVVVSILSISSTTKNLPTKDVYWIHGMGGDKTSLSEMDNYFINRYRYINYRPEYSTSDGIYGSSRNLYSKLNSANASQKSIFIAHSMGGVNSRALLDEHPEYYGGIITLATPHNGAPVAANLDNGKFDEFSKGLNNKGLSGPESEALLLTAGFIDPTGISIIRVLVGSARLYLKDALGDLINKGIRKQAMDAMGSNTTKNALKPNSNDLQKLNRKSLSIPNIAIWGNEDYPTFTRFISSRKTKSDSEFVILINKIRDASKARMKWHEVHKWLNPFFAGAHKRLESDWRESYQYWNGQFQNASNDLIGANVVRYRTVYYDDYECRPAPDKYGVYLNPDGSTSRGSLPAEDLCRLVRKSKQVPYNVTLPNDGLLPDDTQKAMPGCDLKIEARHCNHDEMKYDPRVRNIINNIFKGDYQAPEDEEFFELTKKY